MSASSMVHVRVDMPLKDQLNQTLAAMGLTVSEAVRAFFKRVVAEQALPFELKVPNAQTRAAIEESRRQMAQGTPRFSTAQALLDNLEKNIRP